MTKILHMLTCSIQPGMSSSYKWHANSLFDSDSLANHSKCKIRRSYGQRHCSQLAASIVILALAASPAREEYVASIRVTSAVTHFYSAKQCKRLRVFVVVARSEAMCIAPRTFLLRIAARRLKMQYVSSQFIPFSSRPVCFLSSRSWFNSLRATQHMEVRLWEQYRRCRPNHLPPSTRKQQSSFHPLAHHPTRASSIVRARARCQVSRNRRLSSYPLGLLLNQTFLSKIVM